MSAAESLEKDVRVAENWLVKHLDVVGQSRTPAAIRKALEAYAETISGETFRRARLCLKRHQVAHGFHTAARVIAETKNPVPEGQRKKNKKKQRRSRVTTGIN